MSDAPGTVAKAFLDALPSLDYGKLVAGARKTLTLVIAGDAATVEALRALLLAGGEVPADSKLQLLSYVPGQAKPAEAGKPELAVVVPGTEEVAAQVREAYPGVPLLRLLLDGDMDAAANKDAAKYREIVHLPDLEEASVGDRLVPVLVDVLWEQRLAAGRGLPALRGRLTWRLIQTAARDLKVLLGSVAGAGAGRTGAPTAATAQLLMHQATLIVSIAAVSGAQLEDRKAVFKHVAPTLLPTLLLDGAEAVISRLAAGDTGRRHGTIYAQLSAYTARPALSVTSTFLAGMTARRAFHVTGPSRSIATTARNLGKSVQAGAAQGLAMGASASARLKLFRRQSKRHSHPLPDSISDQEAAPAVPEAENTPGEQ
jgi:hypothetical protein